jgi:predicted GTPase
VRRVLIMGAAGRDFHNFNVVFRDDPEYLVVAFTAAQIPGIEGRVYPASLAGPRYPEGIPIVSEHDLTEIVQRERVDVVVLAYSDLTHEDVMHRASIALAAGADFTLLGPRTTMVHSRKPVVAVCATRTGAGKSQTSRRIGQILLDAGLRVALVRHPMPYGPLERARVQRFDSLAAIDAADPTIEEREEYEAPVELGMVVYAGVDYAEIIERATSEADVVVWDGGNNDFPFVEPDVLVVVADPLRAGDELRYHPGETCLRMADIVLVNKLDSAAPDALRQLLETIERVNSRAIVVRAESPIMLGPGPELHGRRVLVIEDGPTLTHGGMAFGAGTIAARQHGAATIVDPRPWATGSIAETFARYPNIGAVLPAMGYSKAQLDELAHTIRAVECDAVVTGTPIDLGRLIDAGHPLRHATYELRELGTPNLAQILAPLVERARASSIQEEQAPGRERRS